MQRVVRFVAALAIALLPLLSLVSPAQAYTYRAQVAISNNTTTVYSMLPVIWAQNNSFLASNGFMASSANDTNVQTLGGQVRPHMVTDNRTLTALAVPAISQNNMQFTTGNTPSAAAQSIITGYGGYVTTNDTAALEWGVDGGVTITPYLTMAAGNILLKPDAVAVSANFSGNVTAQLIGATWETPAVGLVSEVGAFDGWNAANLVDGNIATEGFHTNTTASGVYVLVDYGAGNTKNLSGWRFYNELGAGQVKHFAIDHSSDGATWVTDYADLAVSDAVAGWYSATWWSKGSFRYWRAKFTTVDSPSGVMEMQVLPGAYLSLPTSAGQPTITVGVNGGNARLAVNSSVTTATFASTADSTSNWVWMSTSVPYIGSVNMTVGGTEVLRYQPNAIVLGSILPDRDGTKNGDITWGANPTGVSVSVGSLISTGQPVYSGTTTTTRDILPPTGGSDWSQDADVDPVLLLNPLRPLVVAISDSTTFTEQQVWFWSGLLIEAMVFGFCLRFLKGHLGITFIAVGTVMIGLSAARIFPLWGIAPGVLIMGLSRLVHERSPAL